MPSSVRSSAKVCADSVTSAVQRSPNAAAVSTAMAPPTLWPKATKRAMSSCSARAGTLACASRRTKAGVSVSPQASDWPKPSRSYATTRRPVACASAAGKSRHSATLPSESWNSSTGALSAAAPSGVQLRANSRPAGVATR